jgi:hypothetical protein
MLVDGIVAYGTLVILSAAFFYLLKFCGFFRVKNPSLNEKLAEADTDFYKKSVNFANNRRTKKTS